MRSLPMISCCLAVLAGCQNPAPSSQDPALPRPTPAQLAWTRAELGAVFHYDLHVFDGKSYGQGGNRAKPMEDIQIFAPKKLDMDQWMEAVKVMGGRFALLTATHETGFALWPSKANPYNVSKLRWRKGRANLVRDFVRAAHRHGIQPGIYLGVRWNSHLGVMDFKVTKRSPLTQTQYNHMVEGMVTEICRDYGPLFELWFDGGILAPEDGGPDVLPIALKYQPQMLFYHSNQRREARWAGNEQGVAEDTAWMTARASVLAGKGVSPKEQMRMYRRGDPDGELWCPVMADVPLRNANGRHEWFWEPGDEGNILPVDRLVSMYEKSVGRSATLIVGLTPDPSGRIPRGDMQRLRAFGKLIDAKWTRPIARLQAGRGSQFTIDTRGKGEIHGLSIGEDIRRGQRIRRWVLEGLTTGAAPVVLAKGQSIGHKRLVALSKPAPYASVRFRILESIGTPILDHLDAYGAPEPSTALDLGPRLQKLRPENIFEDPDWFQWGGSIIRGDDGRYYLYYSRWKKKDGWLQWLTHSEVAIASSSTPHGPWRFERVALEGRGKGHWDEIQAHNPKIKRFGNRYYLYYISTRPLKTRYETRNAQRTGVAIASHPLGPWKRLDHPLIDPSPPLMHTLTVNPAIASKDGKHFVLMVKGDRRAWPGHAVPRVQAIATGTSPIGPFRYRGLAIEDFDTEDASLWWDKKRSCYFAIYHAHTHIGLIRSADGIHWTSARYSRVTGKTLWTTDGKAFEAPRLERPNVYLDPRTGEPSVLILAVKKSAKRSVVLTVPLARKAKPASTKKR